jgi:hypothetical protein
MFVISFSYPDLEAKLILSEEPVLEMTEKDVLLLLCLQLPQKDRARLFHILAKALELLRPERMSIT